MLSSDHLTVVQSVVTDGVVKRSKSAVSIKALAAIINEPEAVTAAAFLPLYMQIRAEAEAAGLEMVRRCENQPDFDVTAFERQFIHPAWARASAFAALLISAPVLTERDLIAKAYVVAEDLADGVTDKERGTRMMADCLTSLEQEFH